MLNRLRTYMSRSGIRRATECHYRRKFVHNPAYLANEILGDLPTCAVVRLDVDCGSWRDLGPAVCTLREVDTPKNPA